MKQFTSMSKIASWLKNRKWSDWLFAFIIILALATRLPIFIEQFNQQGTKLTPIVLNGKLFPPPGQKAILVFWSTWCGPCSMELSRINSAIDKKEFSPANVYAVNMGEAKELVDKEIRKRKYNFAIVNDDKSELANSLNVKVTPTITFISESGKIEWLSSGISPSLVYRIKYFLN